MNETGSDVHHVTGRFYWCDALKILPLLLDEYENRIQLIYMDPPFMTGQTFRFQQPVGVEGWSGNRQYIINHVAYGDPGRADKDFFLSMMRSIISYAYQLLSPEGSLYLHADYRASAYLRIILDEIFGEDNMLNEIIWHYQSGGRAKKHFSRKHDTILFYRKSSNHYFNPEAIGIPRGRNRRNHMKQGVDPDGRVFWSIKAGAKEYRYYEDDKMYPSDVWSDISHLHQRDPERRGYDTQKPEALLERIILASSRPGDTVADFLAGSGTTLAVAQRLGRNWLGADNGIFALHTCRKRLVGDVSGCKELTFYYRIPSENPVSRQPGADRGKLLPIPTGRQKPDCTDLGWGVKRDAALETDIDVYYGNKWMDELPEIELECIRSTDGYVSIRLTKYGIPEMHSRLLKSDNHPYQSIEGLHLGPLDLVDYWAAGYVEDDVFKVLSCSMRTINSPYLKEWLKMALKPDHTPAVHIVDVFGRQWFFAIEPTK